MKALTLILCLSMVFASMALKLNLSNFVKGKQPIWGLVSKLVGAAMISTPMSPAIAVTQPTEIYVNDRYHTSFQYPRSYERMQGTIMGGRSVEAFVKPGEATTSVSVVFTPIPGDFTRLTSFGTGKDTIRDYLLPRGENVLNSQVLDEKVKGENYFIEYVVSTAEDAGGTASAKPVERHVLSAFCLRPAESVVGLTIQTLASDWENNKEDLEQIIPSLKIDLN